MESSNLPFFSDNQLADFMYEDHIRLKCNKKRPMLRIAVEREDCMLGIWLDKGGRILIQQSCEITFQTGKNTYESFRVTQDQR